MSRGIEHYGSTAVDGLRAKPILDILVGITPLDDWIEIVSTLWRHWATTTSKMPVCQVTTSLGEVAIGASERIWFTSWSSRVSRGDGTWPFAMRSEQMRPYGRNTCE